MNGHHVSGSAPGRYTGTPHRSNGYLAARPHRMHPNIDDAAGRPTHWATPPRRPDPQDRSDLDRTSDGRELSMTERIHRNLFSHYRKG